MALNELIYLFVLEKKETNKDLKKFKGSIKTF